MNGLMRGVKNAFRNKVRTVSIVLILGLSMGLALSMLIANQAVTDKIESVKSSIGNTVSISPAGARGFEGGGDPLTSDDLAKVSALDHVSSVIKTLSDHHFIADVDIAGFPRRAIDSDFAYAIMVVRCIKP